MLVLVDRIHRQQAEPVTDIAVERHAQIARRVPNHERDEFGGGLLGSEDQIAFVLAVLVIDDDHGLSGGDVGHRPLDRIEPRHRHHPAGSGLGTHKTLRSTWIAQVNTLQYEPRAEAGYCPPVCQVQVRGLGRANPLNMVIEKINDLFSGDHPDSGVNNAEIPQKPMGELVPIVYRALRTSA